MIISVVPWNDPLLPVQGSYQRALEIMNVPYAKTIVDIVVLFAVASCLNSAINISSRMVYSLSKRNEAPGFLQRTSSAGVPRAAVIASTVIGIATTALNFFAPSQVFAFLLASSGAIALLVYRVIAFSQLRMRAKLTKTHGRIEFKMWLFPWLTWLVIGFIVFAVGVMVAMPAHRSEVLSTGALTIVIIALGLKKTRRHSHRAAYTQASGKL
ncbi:GABA permease [compost metagenome]